MLFNSLLFVLFLPLCLLVRWRLPGGWQARKGALIALSLFFYGVWSALYLIPITISALIDWRLAKAMEATQDATKRWRLMLLSLCSNLGMLGFFKYTNFMIDNLNALNALIGFEPVAQPNILLPVGISFYTFQTLSYSIDVYRGRLKSWDSFWDFFLFVTFFPQLVAGPIVRAIDFKPQSDAPIDRRDSQIGWGLLLFVLGLVQKVIFADTYLTPSVDKVFAAGVVPGWLDAWAGTLAFSAQIYFDFAGYSLCAIGIALALGFKFERNFHSPYGALGFSDFWRRWHISLSGWLRDYLYISLGGNRRGELRTYVNLCMTMLLGGLWHGASWNFVIWGALHGAYLVLERLARPTLERATFLHNKLGLMLGALLTYLLANIAWVPFRAVSLKDTLHVWRGMLGLNDAPRILSGGDLLYPMLVVLGMWLGQQYFARVDFETTLRRLPPVALGLLLGVCIVALIIHRGNGNAFIYFQF